MALASLIANGAIERMINQQEFNHPFPCINYLFAGYDRWNRIVADWYARFIRRFNFSAYAIATGGLSI